MYSRPGPEDKLGQDYDAVGHLDVTVMDKIGVPRNADFYLCGPPPFLGSLTTGLKTWGVTSSCVHQEIFGPSESVTPGIAGAPTRMPHLPAETPGVGPRISFVRSGLVVPWDPAFQSLLELAEACDVSVKWSCRTGVCHTCECALISGAVTYLPEPLEDPADGNILICCSQPRGDTEIDL